MFTNKFYYLILLLLTYVIFSEEVQKSCSYFKNNTEFLCDDSDLFLILIYGKSFNDPKRIEFKWMNQSLVIECKKYDQTVKEFNISFENVSELKITNCFIRLHNIFKFFPNLIESKVSSISSNYKYFLPRNWVPNYSPVQTWKVDVNSVFNNIWKGYEDKIYSFIVLPNLKRLRIKINLANTDFPIIFSSKHLGVYHLKNIENLEELSFSGMPIQNLTLDKNSLKVLDLSSGSFESFPDIVFKNNSTLTSLIFQFNNIHIVENLFGYDFNNIEKLDLKGNYITNLPVLAFPKLKYLDLSYNKILTIQNDAFKNTKLTFLNLRSNIVRSYPNNFFKSLKFLEELQFDLDINKENYDLKNLKTLTIFLENCSDSKLIIFESFLKQNENLEKLNIIFSTFSNNSQNEFIILKNVILKNLTKLYIENKNDKKIILDTLFLRNHSKLKEISLLYETELKPFENLKNLLKVELNTNIREINIDFFKDQLELLYLSLSLNNLQSLPEKLLENNKQLLNLDLCCNKLEHLPRKLFSSLKRLIVLDLSDNQISSFHDYTFKPLENIRRINLSKNKLKTFNYKAFLEGVYSMARDLQFQDIKLNIDLELPSYDELTTGSLDLRDNDNYLLDTFNPTKLNNELNTSKTKKSWIFNINVLNKTECYCHLYDIYSLLTLKQSFENLKFVELSVMCDIPTKNYLDEYSEKDFQSMTNPRTCPGNCIESVSRLDCSNSGMTTIPEINERNIKELDLRNNKLIYLDQTFIDVIKKYDIPTYLSGNDWKCDCDNLTFVDLVRNTSQIRDEVNCWLDEGNKISTKFTDDKIQEMCSTSSHFYIILILASFVLLFGTSSLSLYFRKEIRIWLFAHRMFLCCNSEEEVDKSRIYDAFICFSHEDEHYVEQIAQVLESGPNPYRLCLHFRDWLVGEYISTQIVNSVDKSKRTIFIITNNFLKSMWSRLEFRTACASSLKEKRPRLIVVLCQEIEELGQLDSEIKAYFNSNTYLKWNDRLFWSRLKYALPHRKGEHKYNDIELEEI